MESHVALKKTWSGIKGKWVEPDVRDSVVDYVRYWSLRTGINSMVLVDLIGISRGKYYEWRKRYGKVNEHNSWVPRDFWLEAWEKEAIVEYCVNHPRNGYRRLTYMLMDADIVAASPSSAYRVLKDAELLSQWNRKPTRKGDGFIQPLKAHEHWHIDISYLNIRGTFYYLCSHLDGYSRYIVHWEIAMQGIHDRNRCRDHHPTGVSYFGLLRRIKSSVI